MSHLTEHKMDHVFLTLHADVIFFSLLVCIDCLKRRVVAPTITIQTPLVNVFHLTALFSSSTPILARPHTGGEGCLIGTELCVRK